MTSIGTGYDLYTSQFSPDGRVFQASLITDAQATKRTKPSKRLFLEPVCFPSLQVDYAGKAVENSGTAVALRGKDGVVFAVEKIVASKLYESKACKRIFSVDRHVGLATTGLLADGRALVQVN